MREFSSIEDILATEGIVTSNDAPTMHLIASVVDNRMIIDGMEGFSVDLDVPELNLIDVYNALIKGINNPCVVDIALDDNLSGDEKALEVFRKTRAFMERAIDINNRVLIALERYGGETIFADNDQEGKESSLYIENGDEFNKCFDHIFGLLRDSVTLYKSDSYPRSVFLSITAIEETGKTDIAIFKKKPETKHVKHDPLKDHKKKQRLGSLPVVGMSERLHAAIGTKRVDELLSLAHSGQLKSIRESMLYWDRGSSGLEVPETAVDKGFARSILLFAIESFDRLIAWTEHSMNSWDLVDQMFNEVASL